MGLIAMLERLVLAAKSGVERGNRLGHRAGLELLTESDLQILEIGATLTLHSQTASLLPQYGSLLGPRPFPVPLPGNC
jgi:hypothetical protein